MDVDDAGKSMEGSCESAEAGCCSHEAHTNTQAGTQPYLACMLMSLLTGQLFPSLCLCSSTKLDRAQARSCSRLLCFFQALPLSAASAT